MLELSHFVQPLRLEIIVSIPCLLPEKQTSDESLLFQCGKINSTSVNLTNGQQRVQKKHHFSNSRKCTCCLLGQTIIRFELIVWL